jgi:hypothetical protein
VYRLAGPSGQTERLRCGERRQHGLGTGVQPGDHPALAFGQWSVVQGDGVPDSLPASRRELRPDAVRADTALAQCRARGDPSSVGWGKVLEIHAETVRVDRHGSPTDSESVDDPFEQSMKCISRGSDPAICT